MPLWNYACNQGGPNPDYVYLWAQVDDDGVYEISGFRGTTRFVEITQQQQAMLGMDMFSRPQGDTAPRTASRPRMTSTSCPSPTTVRSGWCSAPSGPMDIRATGGRWIA